MAISDWTYSGDINIRHGGLFWQPGMADDYVEAVEVFPIFDQEYLVAGVIQDSIYMPHDKRHVALETCGYPLDTVDLPLLVDAFHAYGGLNDTSRIFKIQIGGPRAYHPHDYRIAHNASLRKFVEREFL